jgi:hypothetical protein
MSLTQAKAMINSRVALMSSILEQSGHVSEFLNQERYGFSECCKFILYTFYMDTDKELTKAITKSSEIHMRNLSNQGNPCLTNSEWIEIMGQDRIVQGIRDAMIAWSSWEPENEIAKMMKSSFDELF